MRHPTWLPARRLAFAFFFFSQIRADSAQFALMRLDSCRIGYDSRRTGLIRPKSGCISHIGSYRPAAETGWKRPKHAGNGRNWPWIWPEKPKLAFFFLFFCESRHSNVFFKNILIVKIYRKLNKNIFNNFLIAESRRIRTHLFQKLSSSAPAPAPAPESRNAPVLHKAFGYTK